MVWRVAYCAPQREFTARDELVASGFKTFLPYRSQVREYGINRIKKEVSVAEIPGYLFVDGDFDAVGEIRRTRGVLDVICSGSVPVVVPDRVIEKAIVEFNCGLSGLIGEKKAVWEKPKPFSGAFQDKVRIVGDSPLNGLLGYIVSIDNKRPNRAVRVWLAKDKFNGIDALVSREQLENLSVPA